MKKLFLIFVICLFASATMAAPVRRMVASRPTARSAAQFVSPTAYNTMYPAMNDAMRTTLNPGVTPDFSPNSVSTLTRANRANDNRRVVSRAARSATPMAGAGQAAAPVRSAAPITQNVARRVAPRRSAVQTIVNRSAGAPAATVQSATGAISSARCLADYSACMNGYCERADTAYNRCYCSARLAQIDSEYRDSIDDLLTQLATISGGNIYTQAEMDAYWEQMIGRYTGDNSWNNIDAALNIDWADMASRVRGQDAFITGHDYCSQHLRACAYMSSNMRDAYRSEIARDCAAYESSLGAVKSVAESLIEAYGDE
jgi:hypothetical protein